MLENTEIENNSEVSSNNSVCRFCGVELNKNNCKRKDRKSCISCLENRRNSKQPQEGKKAMS